MTLPAVLDSAERGALWRERERLRRPSGPWKRRGVGLAAVWQSFGLGAGIEPGAHTRLELLPDGRYRAFLSAPDLGGGGVTTCLQLAAAELGCEVEDFEVVAGDSRGPNAWSSNASRTTLVVGGSIMDAATRLRARHPAPRSPRPGDPAGPPRLERGRVVAGGRATSLADLAADALASGRGPLAADGFFKPAPPSPMVFGAPPAFACSAQVVLLEVDELTGEIEVLRAENHLEVGRAINPQGVRGQSEGGMAQGLGYALLEETGMRGGRAGNTRLSTYLIPTMQDVPAQVETVLLEHPEPASPHGGRGVGEIGLSPAAAAICNALADAIGARFDRLPVTPEQVLEALSRGVAP